VWKVWYRGIIHMVIHSLTTNCASRFFTSFGLRLEGQMEFSFTL
jgi:hypothetical protein